MLPDYSQPKAAAIHLSEHCLSFVSQEAKGTQVLLSVLLVKKYKAMLKGTQEVHCCRNVCLLATLGYGSWHLWGSLWVPQTLYSSFH